ncbi:MAG: hypothetical protein IH628_11390, partial [Proteobacteria bacterium]|nr:hypothetical protein [Pseudomonadota bacterium]
MRTLLRIAFLLVALGFLAAPAAAQWSCLYATYDDDINGTGHNTPSVGVISEDTFIALVMTPDARNFMVPYTSADSALGRLYTYGYGGATSGIYQVWSDYGFDQVVMNNAAKIVATSDGVIYVANNDPYHNILVFKLANDTVDTFAPYYRQETGSNAIFVLAVDQNGYVYVSNDTTTGQTDDIKVFSPITTWAPPYTASPVQIIDLPDGVYRGVEVSPDGSQLFIADYTNRRILKYTGSPSTGYSYDGSFIFTLGVADTGSAGLPNGPVNMAYLGSNNILFAAVDVHGYASTTRDYSYGRIYLVNPFTGDLVSTDSSVSMIDVAQWNLDQTGDYSTRSGGTVPGNASGYTSTYDVA